MSFIIEERPHLIDPSRKDCTWFWFVYYYFIILTISSSFGSSSVSVPVSITDDSVWK